MAILIKAEALSQQHRCRRPVDVARRSRAAEGIGLKAHFLHGMQELEA